MKKTLVLIVLVISIFSLCACAGGGSFTDIDNMAKQNYTVVERTIKTTASGETLTSHFTVRGTDEVKIDYSVEQINKIDISNMPNDYKTTKTGSVKLNGTQITEQTGDEIDVNFVAMAKLNLNFVKEYFTQVRWSKNKMTANVSNIEGFLGANVQCSWMKVEADYSSVLKEVTVEYLTVNGAEVQITYAFTA